MSMVLTFLLFAVAVGMIGGGKMQAGNPDGCGWLFLTVPMATIMIGIPAATLFAIADSALLDSLLGWAGSWRTGFVAPIVPAVIVAKRYRVHRRNAQNSNRPVRTGEQLVRPLIGWAFLSQLMVPLWLGAKWVGAAV